MFFAGPCTGGSSWASLNRSKGPETEAIVEAKVRIFEQLWGRFEMLFVAYYDKQIGVYMELPRGCQYWDNEDVKFMIEGTESTTHDFDGCCYGLRQKFGDMNKYIKKPWRIVSWNVDVGSKLSLKCDGRHEHAPCAGRETLHTQVYTSKIVSVILEEQHRRCSDIEYPIIIPRTAGSSGPGNKKSRIASPCVSVSKSSRRLNGVAIESSLVTAMLRQLCNIIVPEYNHKLVFRLRWIHSPLSRSKRNPNSGTPQPGRPGRGARRDPTGISPVLMPWRRQVVLDHEPEEQRKMIGPRSS